MNFVLVFITAQMTQGGANLGPLPGAPEFDNLQLCQAALRKYPAPAPNQITGWHCVPDVTQ